MRNALLTQLAEDARKRTIKLMAVMQLMRKINPMWGPCMVMLLFGLLTAAHANPAGFFAGYVGARRMAAELWTPADLDGLALWLDADDSSTLWEDTNATTAATNNGLVARWDDKSGKGNHATRATVTNQPVYGTSAINGMPALLFDGVNDSLMQTFNAALVPPYTINVVANRTAGSFYQRVFSGSPDSRLLVGALNGNYISTTGDGAAWNGISAANTPLTQIASASRVLTAIVETGSTSPFIDGVAMDVRNNTLNANSVPSFILGGQNNQWWNGEVFEVVVLASALSTADRQKLEGYLAHKWGLEDNLPADHPYKTAAPIKE